MTTWHIPGLGPSLGEGSAQPLEPGDPKSRELPAGLGAALPAGVANSKLGEGFKLWEFPFLGCKLLVGDDGDTWGQLCGAL